MDKFINSGLNIVLEIGIAPFELVGEVTLVNHITKREGNILGIVFAGSSDFIDSQLSEVSE